MVLIIGVFLVVISMLLLKLLILKRRLFIWILFLCCLLLGIMFTYIGYNIYNYRVFSKEEPVAVIECNPVKGEIYDMVLLMQRMHRGKPRQKDKFLLTGNQWLIEGNILKCNLPGDFGDIHLYKITRIRARFLNPRNKKQSPQIAYNINSSDRLWHFLNKHKLAFVGTVPADTGFNFPDKKKKFYLYASASGFIVKKKK